MITRLWRYLGRQNVAASENTREEYYFALNNIDDVFPSRYLTHFKTVLTVLKITLFFKTLNYH